MQFKDFEELLLSRKEHLFEILNMRHSQIKELHSSTIADDTDVVLANQQGQFDSLLIEKYSLELQEIERALGKLKDNIYGICEMCGEAISHGRLHIKPHARYCIECREIYEKQEENPRD